MSLNKFTNIVKNKPLNFEIGCNKLECDDAKVGQLIYNGPLFEGKLGQHEDAILTNRIDDASIFGDLPPTYIGSRDFDANEMKDGYAFKVSASGSMTSISGSNLSFNVFVGPAVSPLQIFNLVMNPLPDFVSSTGLWTLDIKSVCTRKTTLNDDPERQLMYTTGSFRVTMPNGPDFITYFRGNAAGGIGNEVENNFWDSVQTLDVTAKWNVLNIANSFNVEKVIVERVR